MDLREVDIVAAPFCAADWRALSYEARRPYRVAALQAIKALDEHRAARGEVAQDKRGVRPNGGSEAAAGVIRRLSMPLLLLSGIGAFVLAVLSSVTRAALQPDGLALAQSLVLYGP